MKFSPESAVPSGARASQSVKMKNCSSTMVMERMVVAQLRCQAMAREPSKVI